MIYFDNAATSNPKPPDVVNAVQQALLESANPGRSGHALSINAGRIVLSVREELAALFGVDDPFRFVFCFNCTDALNQAIKGTLSRGDHVVASALDHNSVLRPLKGLERRGLIDVTLVSPREDGFLHPADYEAALTPRTRLAVLTHASNVTGAVQPLDAIAQRCRSRGVLLLLDAAQTAGVLPLALDNIDLCAMPGHKGLLGPQGIGALYIRPGLTLGPLREGGTGSSSENWFQPAEMPERYESGTLNTPGIAGLLEGIRYVRANLDEIQAHERRLSGVLLYGLKATLGVTVYSPESHRVGVVSFNVGDESSGSIADALDREGMAVRGGLHCAPMAHAFLGTLKRGAVRASVGYANTLGEVETFLACIKRLAAT